MIEESKLIPIKGMHCASCAANLEHVFRKVPGVSSVNVNFATEKARIKGSVDLGQIKKAAQSIGYDIGGEGAEGAEDEQKVKTQELSAKRNKLVIGGVLASLLMILSLKDM